MVAFLFKKIKTTVEMSQKRAFLRHLHSFPTRLKGDRSADAVKRRRVWRKLERRYSWAVFRRSNRLKNIPYVINLQNQATNPKNNEHYNQQGSNDYPKNKPHLSHLQICRPSEPPPQGPQMKGPCRSYGIFYSCSWV